MTRDRVVAEVAPVGDEDAIREILVDVCRITEMGFAAVARVTSRQWIAYQVVDRIELGLNPGDELDLKTTICDEIRQHGRAVVIDSVADDPEWRTHHAPMLYGFESYAALPIVLADGRFYGTLCAIDPEPRTLNAASTVAVMQAFAQRVAAILSRLSVSH